MPLFSFVSGYLLLGSLRRHPEGLLRRRARSLLLPCAFWATVEMIVTLAVQAAAGDFVFSAWFKMLVRTFLTGLWFPWAMLWCTLAVLTVERGLGGSSAAYASLLALSLLWPNSWNLASTSYMLPFFVVGFRLKRSGRSLADLTGRRAATALLLAGVAYVSTALLLWDRDVYVYVTGTCLLTAADSARQLGIDLLRVGTGFLGVATAVAACSLLRRLEGFSCALAALGGTSFAVYVLNVYTCRALVLLPFSEPSPLVWAALTALLLPAYWALDRAVGRLPVLNTLAFGAPPRRRS